MKKTVIKGIAFVVIFVISLVVISMVANQGNGDMTAPMSTACLPTMAIVEDGQEINQMYGYTMQMDTADMRESITPIKTARQINAVVHGYGTEIAGVSYELRSIDGSRLIENTELTGTQEGDDLYLFFRLKDLMKEGEEYSLIFLVNLDESRQVRYYTRVIQADYYLTEKLDFVTSFSDATFDAEVFAEKGYAKKLETNSDGDNSSFAHVDIHCTSSQVTWGSLDVTRIEKPQIWVKEIAPQTASFVLSYPVSYTEGGSQVSASVTEYYRVRYTGDTMYLLDYERTVTQYFTEKSSRFTESGLQLGITDKNVVMKESDGGNVFAFVQAGGLYVYNSADNRLARLHSFRDEDNDDLRARYENHNYEVLQVDETGNVTFLVYGYMNRGRHEGECGVSVCYYSSTLNVTEEMVFIPYNKSAGLLKADLETLSYVNGKNDLYLMVDGNIWHIGLEDKSSEIVVSGISTAGCRVAENDSMLVWQKDLKDYGSTLEFMNLNSGKLTELKAGEGNFIQALGFMGEDLIYGIASAEQVQEDAVGNQLFPMHQIRIQDFEGNILKSYEQAGVYVTGCRIEENQISLERISLADGRVTELSEDQILYNDEIPESKNYAETASTQETENIVRIVLNSVPDAKKVKILTPKEVIFEGSREIVLNGEEDQNRYYVYGQYGVIGIEKDPAAAVRRAYEAAGAVTDEAGRYLNKRDRLHSSNQIMAIDGDYADNERSSLAVCLDTIFQYEGMVKNSSSLLAAGQDVLTILEENLDNRTVLNLQGCTLDMVLYYPDREIPVLAVMQDGSAVLVIGFNEQNVVLMDPLTGTVYKKGMNDARSMFEENGNRFIAYS